MVETLFDLAVLAVAALSCVVIVTALCARDDEADGDDVTPGDT